MEEFIRKHKNHETGKFDRYVKYRVYTKDEADKLGLKYRYWQNALQGDEWALSDDGYVGQILRIKIYENKNGLKRKCVTLSFGYNFVPTTVPLRWEERKVHRSWGRISTDHNDRYLARKNKHVLRRYVAERLAYGHKNVNWEVLGKEFRPDVTRPVRAIKEFLNRAEVKKVVDKMMLEQLKENGVDNQSYIDFLKKNLKYVEEQEDAELGLKYLTKLEEILGLNQKVDVNAIETVEWDKLDEKATVKREIDVKGVSPGQLSDDNSEV